MSSVQPNDSISSVSSQAKRQKPGKNERAAKKALSAVGAGSSAHKAALFAAGARGDPVPQPGRFPVVFATGAGEPSRDAEFIVNPRVIWDITDSLPGRYTQNPLYAEFRANSDLTDEGFEKHLRVAFYLGLAQRIVHAHVNMDLPLGDFGPLNSTDVRLLGSMQTILTQFGEFSEASLGTRFLLKDYTSTVRKLIFWASETQNGRHLAARDRGWLPASSSDKTTAAFIAARLNAWLGTTYSLNVKAQLEDTVLNGEVPDFWDALKPLLASTGDEDRFDFLFKSYASEGQFTTAFTTPSAAGVLTELSMPWANASAGHLNWSFNAKERFVSLSDAWARISVTFARFFEMGTTLSEKGSALGSPAQLATVTTVDTVTVVKSVLALSAPQFSLAACFPSQCILLEGLPQKVVVTSPVPARQRATEFCQRDWR